MRFTEIDAIKLEDKLDEILGVGTYTLLNIVDDSRLSQDENTYNKIKMNEGDKESFDWFMSKLTAIKTALKSERSDELFNSVNISNLVDYLFSIGVVFSQYSSYVRSKADEDDQDFFDQMVIEEQKYLRKVKDEKAVRYGRALRRVCNRNMELIGGINGYEKQLTKDEIDVMEFTYKDIQLKLEGLRPDTAYRLLLLAEPDGTIVLQEDIDRLKASLEEGLMELATLKAELDS